MYVQGSHMFAMFSVYVLRQGSGSMNTNVMTNTKFAVWAIASITVLVSGYTVLFSGPLFSCLVCGTCLKKKKCGPALITSKVKKYYLECNSPIHNMFAWLPTSLTSNYSFPRYLFTFVPN